MPLMEDFTKQGTDQRLGREMCHSNYIGAARIESCLGGSSGVHRDLSLEPNVGQVPAETSFSHRLKPRLGVLLDFSGKEGESTRYHHTTFWPPAKNMVPLCPRRISILRLISSDPMLVCLDSTLLTVFVGESLNKCTYQSISWTFPVCACAINLGFASKDPEWWPKRVDSRNARTHLENGGREE